MRIILFFLYYMFVFNLFVLTIHSNNTIGNNTILIDILLTIRNSMIKDIIPQHFWIIFMIKYLCFYVFFKLFESTKFDYVPIAWFK